MDSLDSLTTLQALQINLCSLFPPFLSQTGNLEQGTSGTSRAKVEQKKEKLSEKKIATFLSPPPASAYTEERLKKDQMEKKRLGSFSTVPFSFSRIFRP